MLRPIQMYKYKSRREDERAKKQENETAKKSGGLREALHDGHGIVVEYGGDVFRGELVGGVADEQTCLSDCTVADDDAPGGRGISI